MQKIVKRSLYRGIDANFNRAKEGLRVCEDICRFALNDRRATGSFKVLRHRLSDTIGLLKLADVIKARGVENDVGRGNAKTEFRRKEMADIFYANVQRVKESVRVLEEFSKLVNTDVSKQLKSLRYKVYALEKKITVGF